VKLISFEAAGRSSFGVVKDGKVIDLGPRLDGVDGLEDLLDVDAQARAAAAAEGATADFDLSDIRYRRPIAYPEKIICVGVNYAHRNEEYDDTSLPDYPSVFLRTPDSFVAHGEPILRPPESERLDYEGEIAIVVGKGGRRIPKESALDHIAGLTCLNEGTIRDWTRHGKFNVTQGKNFDRSGSIGPWMVTADEFGASGYAGLQVTTRVNGEVRQDDTTANLIFDFPYMISYLSIWTALKPGDVISTGTPIGAGARFDPPKWLVPGDVVEVEVSGIGTLSNPIADEV
jgi:5-carboxymethyl-2-hydroxymuconate isomerase